MEDMLHPVLEGGKAPTRLTWEVTPLAGGVGAPSHTHGFEPMPTLGHTGVSIFQEGYFEGAGL